MIAITLALILLQSCVQPQPQGSLLIKADTEAQANYSIYRIDANKPLRLVAKHQGIYNQHLSLPASDYLVLADCSHAKVQIKAGQLTELQSFHLEFASPHAHPSYFPVQCSQFETLNLRQQFRDKFHFWLLKPKANLLIAAKQLAVDFQDKHYRRYDLSALRVGATSQQEDYFIYPHDNLLAVTKRQKTGQWISMLAGDYVIEFNGTRTEVSLSTRAYLTLPTASLVITANHASSSDITLFNAGQTIYFNQPFVTLPTTMHLSLHPASSPLTLKLTDDTMIAARSIMLVPPCSSESACQEQHLEFFLYEKDEKAPFVRAKIGERVFFARADVSVAIEGSQGIRYRLPNSSRDAVFKLGKLKLNYLKHTNSKHYTDLLRLEARDSKMSGNSIDLRFGGNHGTLLIAGKYDIAHYVSAVAVSDANKTASKQVLNKQGGRRRYLHPLRVVAGKTSIHSQKIIARN